MEKGIFVMWKPFVLLQMSDKKPIRVRDWPQVSAHVDPDSKRAFDNKLKETGDDKSEVIRRAIRDYTRKS
jgi:hypothetical protein